MRGTVRRWKAGEILFQTMCPLPMQFFRCSVFIISKIRWFFRWKFFIYLINLKLTFICFSIPLKTLQQCLIINHQRFLYFKLLMQRNLSKSDKSFRDFQKESFYQKSLRRRIFLSSNQNYFLRSFFPRIVYESFCILIYKEKQDISLLTGYPGIEIKHCTVHRVVYTEVHISNNSLLEFLKYFLCFS